MRKLFVSFLVCLSVILSWTIASATLMPTEEIQEETVVEVIDKEVIEAVEGELASLDTQFEDEIVEALHVIAEKYNLTIEDIIDIYAQWLSKSQD